MRHLSDAFRPAAILCLASVLLLSTGCGTDPVAVTPVADTATAEDGVGADGAGADGGVADTAMLGDGATSGDTSSSTDADTNASTDVGTSSNTTCTFNVDCPTNERCECSVAAGCFCKIGVRGTGKMGVDTCKSSDDCETALCLEGPGDVYYCSGPCSSAKDCGGTLPLCSQIAFVGQICIRDPKAK